MSGADERPLRLVTGDPDPAPADDVAAETATDPLDELVQQIEDLPLSERPAAFERVNAGLVAALNALEEV